MIWDELRDNWQHTAVVPLPASTVEDTLRRARRLRLQIMWRDGLETVVALALMPMVWIWLRNAMQMHIILSELSAALLLGWLIYIPWRLWRARRLLPRHDPGLPLQRYLQRERQAMLAQARMLEQVAWWYLAPAAVGITGLTLGNRGPTLAAFAYITALLLLCLLIYGLNRWTAERTFRRRASALDASCRELQELEATPLTTFVDDSTAKDNRHDP